MMNKKTAAHPLALAFVFLPATAFADQAVGFAGQYQSGNSDISIAGGGPKLQVKFDLQYDYVSAQGPTANLGSAQGEASLAGNVATFTNREFGGLCTITLTFSPDRTTLKAAQKEAPDGACGFGNNVRADGTYRKLASATPVPAQVSAVAIAATKRTLLARDAATKARKDAERLAASRKTAEATIWSVAEEVKRSTEAARTAFTSYQTLRQAAGTAAFPRKELEAAKAAAVAGIKSNNTTSKPMVTARGNAADLEKALAAVEKAAAEAQTAASQAAVGGQAQAEKARQAAQVAQEEAAKVHALPSLANLAELKKSENDFNVALNARLWDLSPILTEIAQRADYELKLSTDPVGKPQCDLKAIDWKNFSYPANSLSGAFRLKKGNAEEALSSEPGDDRSYGIAFNKVSSADLDRDGKPEAYVVINVGGFGRQMMSTNVSYAFDTDASCRIRYLGQVEGCTDDVKLLARSVTVENCMNATRDEYALLNKSFKKVRSTPIP